MPGNYADFDYYHGVGRGGDVNFDGNGGEGSAGAAVIIARVPGTSLPAQADFFFTGKGCHMFPQLDAFRTERTSRFWRKTSWK